MEDVSKHTHVYVPPDATVDVTVRGKNIITSRLDDHEPSKRLLEQLKHEGPWTVSMHPDVLEVKRSATVGGRDVGTMLDDLQRRVFHLEHTVNNMRRYESTEEFTDKWLTYEKDRWFADCRQEDRVPLTRRSRWRRFFCL